jgi:predicted nucleic acid-binding protein
MARYCVDASFLVGWLLPEAASQAARERWLALRDSDELVAPPLVLAECTSTISRQVNARQLDAADGRAQIENALRLPIRLSHGPAQYLRAYDIARALGWGRAYDALYLAVADLELAAIITMDGGMSEAAGRLGIRSELIGA